MGDIAHAPWFLPRRRGQVAEDFINVVAVRLIKRHSYDKTQHNNRPILLTPSAPGQTPVASWSGRDQDQSKPFQSSHLILFLQNLDTPAPASAACRTR